MGDVPVQLIVAAFNSETAADDALTSLYEYKREKAIAILDAAVIKRDANNKLHIKETGDMGGGKGAVVGGVLGGIIGLIAGPPGVIVGGAVGAAVGGLTAKFVDAGIPDDRLRELGSALKPNQSAIVAIIEHIWVEQVRAELAKQGADVMTQALKEDIAKQLAEGKEVTYTAIGTAGGVAAARVVGDANKADVSVIAANREGDVVVGAGEMKMAELPAAANVVDTAEAKVAESKPGEAPAETRPAEAKPDEPKPA
jgi:uncharacterized membrane protein